MRLSRGEHCQGLSKKMVNGTHIYMIMDITSRLTSFDIIEDRQRNIFVNILLPASRKRSDYCRSHHLSTLRLFSLAHFRLFIILQTI